MHVVAAGVSHRHFVAVGGFGGHGARVVHAGAFPDGQRVEFGPQQDGGPGTVSQDAHYSRAADPGLHREAVFLQFPGDALGGAVLVMGQLRMLVQVLVESLLGGLDAVVASQDLIDAVHFSSVLVP